MRQSIQIILGIAVAALATPALAMDTGSGVAGKGYSATVTTSKNRATNYHNATPGFPNNITAGRGARSGTTDTPKTNPTMGGAYGASAPTISIAGGKGYPTLHTVPGRNDPPPNLGGKRHRDQYGGLGM